MKIKTFINSKPIKNEHTTFIGSESATVRVDRIKFNGSYYEARLSHKKEDAPYNDNEWTGFTKSKNKNQSCLTPTAFFFNSGNMVGRVANSYSK